ncbi:hypothetical protein ACFL27_16715 [candidate division CSSED10-310 bacterium]|uniref:Uncharacterized protein n=1 Tax=candidate division CSSED10-310 bacterium TaxID=2855610 RepID=A0ABV6Z071_UNCC1
MSISVPAEVIGKLREATVSLMKSKFKKEIVEPEEAVLARFQPIFSAEHIPSLTEEEFRSFLLPENNHHWSGLHRQGSRMCADMTKLRQALILLVNEDLPVSDRLDEATKTVFGMGKNIASAILLVTQPDRYGVWNNPSEANMKRLGIWPKFDRGELFGSRYVKVNQILLELRDALQIDLWTIDALWWFLDREVSEDTGIPDVEYSDSAGGHIITEVCRNSSLF